MAEDTTSIFGRCLGRQLVSCSRKFEEAYTNTERLSGGGDTGPRRKQKLMPTVLRRSARLNPAAKQDDKGKVSPKRKRRQNTTQKTAAPDDDPNNASKNNSDAQKDSSKDNPKAAQKVDAKDAPPIVFPKIAPQVAPKEKRQRGKRKLNPMNEGQSITLNPMQKQEDKGKISPKRKRRSNTTEKPADAVDDTNDASKNNSIVVQKDDARDDPTQEPSTVDPKIAEKDDARDNPTQDLPIDDPKVAQKVDTRNAPTQAPPTDDPNVAHNQNDVSRDDPTQDLAIDDPNVAENDVARDDPTQAPPTSDPKIGEKDDSRNAPTQASSTVDPNVAHNQNDVSRDDPTNAPPTDDPKVDPQAAPKGKNRVKFTKNVQMQYYETDEASPRRTEEGFRRRSQTGNKINVIVPKEARRLQKPLADFSKRVPWSARREEVLGPATQELTPERELELLRDSGCYSTCHEIGCGAHCLCIRNGILCDDRVCPCDEEECPNGREELEAEDPELFNMRLDLANYDLELESFGPEQSTIASVENDSSWMETTYGGDLSDSVEQAGSSTNSDDVERIDEDNGSQMEPSVGELDMEDDGNVSDDNSDASIRDEINVDAEDADNGSQIEPEDPSVGQLDMDDFGNRSADDSVADASIRDEIDLEAEDADDMEADENAGRAVADDDDMEADEVPAAAPDLDDEEMVEDDPSDESGNHTDSDEDDPDPTPYAGQLPDLGIDLRPEHFPPNLLKNLPRLVNEDARDSCRDGEWLDGTALYVGLLKEASHYNHIDASSSKRCAVLHPNVFHQAMWLAGRDDAEKARRKAARIKTPAPLLPMDPDDIAKLVVYGNDWTTMIIPMHLFGTHWAVSVVSRATLSAVIYDSSKKMAERSKEIAERIKSAVKKCLEVVQQMSPNDTTTARYTVRYARSDHKTVQDDDHSCGVFSIIHARRVLERGNSNASTRKLKKATDPEPNIQTERRQLRQTITELMEFYEDLKTQNQALMHGPGGHLACTPQKTPVTLCRSIRTRSSKPKRRC